MDLQAFIANYQPTDLGYPGQRVQPQKKKKNFFVDQISTATGILGGIAGTAIAPVAGTFGGAAAGSGLGEAIENLITGESFTKNVGKEAALGGVFGAGPLKLLKGGAALAGGKGLGAATLAAQTPLKKLVSQGIGTKIGEDVTNRATTSFLKLTPSQTKRLLDAGTDPTKLAKRAAQFGSSADEIIGQTGNSGPLQLAIKTLEDSIAKTAKTAGTNVRIPGDELVNALKAQARTISQEIGGGARLKQINQIITDAEKKYSKGVTVRQARDILRESNQRFGASILDDSGDAVARAAQKLEGNTMRDALKTRFPTIATALDDESELIQLREILSRTRAVDKTGKFNVGKVDLTRPGSFIDPILNSNKTTSRILRQGGAAETVPKGITSKGIAAREIGQNLLIPRDDAQSFPGNTNDMAMAATNPMTNMMANAPNMMDPLSSQGDQMSTQQSVYTFENAFADMTRDPENAEYYASLYEFANPKTDEKAAKPLSQAQQERADLINSLTMTEDAVNQGSINYGPIGSRVEGLKSIFNRADPETLSYKNTVSGLRAAITKARAGASLTAGELKLLEKYTPSETDSEQVVRSKLQQLRALYGSSPPVGGGSTLEDALMQYAR